jgi:hypothetical protein
MNKGLVEIFREGAVTRGGDRWVKRLFVIWGG